MKADWEPVVFDCKETYRNTETYILKVGKLTPSPLFTGFSSRKKKGQRPKKNKTKIVLRNPA